MLIKLNKKIKKLDIFGRSVELSFNNKKKHKTIIGAIITILIVAAALTAMFFLFQDIIFHRNPNIIIYQQDNVDSNFTIASNSQLLAIEVNGIDGIKPDLHQFIKTTILLTNYRRTQQQTLEKVGSRVIETEICDFSNYDLGQLDQLTQLYFQNMENSYLLCIKKDQQVHLQGDEQSQQLSSLDIIIEFVSNGNITNFIQNRLAKYINSRQVILHYSNTIIYPQKFDTPYIKKGQTFSKTIDLRMKRDIKMQMQKVIVFTDVGLVFNEDISEQHFQLNFISEDYTHTDNSDIYNGSLYNSTLCKINIQNSPNTQIYKRKYIKMYTLFGLLGGLIKILVLLGYIVTRPIAELSFCINVVNKIFDFQQVNEQKLSHLINCTTPKVALRRESDEHSQNKSAVKNNKIDHVVEVIDDESCINNRGGEGEINIDNFMNQDSGDKTGRHLKELCQQDEKGSCYLRSLNTDRRVQTECIVPVSGLSPTTQKQTAFRIRAQFSEDKCNSQQQQHNKESLECTPKHNYILEKSHIHEDDQSSQQCNSQQQSPKQQDRKESTSKTIVIQKMLNQYAINQNHNIDEKEFMEINTIKKTQLKNKPKNKNKILSKLFQKEKTIFAKLGDYILYYFKCMRDSLFYSKKQYLKASFKKVQDRLDLHYILNKIVEIDKLKMLFLDENQIRLFEYLPKPIIYMDQNFRDSINNQNNLQSSWNFLQSKKNQAEKAGEAYKAFLQMLSKKQLTELDKKLMDMIDDKIKYYFDGSIQRKSFILEMNNLNFLNKQDPQQIQLFQQQDEDENDKIPKEKRKSEDPVSINGSTIRIDFNKLQYKARPN